MKEFDLVLSRKLKHVAKRINKVLKQELGEELGFALMVWPWAEGPSGFKDGEVARFQYVSNAPRPFAQEVLTQLLEKWRADPTDVPPHQEN